MIPYANSDLMKIIQQWTMEGSATSDIYFIQNSQQSEAQVQFTENTGDKRKTNVKKCKKPVPSEEQLNKQQVPVHHPLENQAACLKKIEWIF
jgi:hypothetical protein